MVHCGWRAAIAPVSNPEKVDLFVPQVFSGGLCAGQMWYDIPKAFYTYKQIDLKHYSQIIYGCHLNSDCTGPNNCEIYSLNITNRTEASRWYLGNG